MICQQIRNTVRLFRSLTFFLLLVFFITNCNKEAEPLCDVNCIPEGFPPMEFPDSNFYTKERWDLGKKLFYEKGLSIDSSISCGSCHLPQHFFADNKRFSEGAQNQIGTRNSTSLGNIGYHPYFLREGGVPTLEMQILVPIQEHNEFNHNIVDIAEQLSKNADYTQMSRNAYNRDIDPYVITRAIATFERTLISGNSKYDKSLNKKLSLSQEEINGMNLFFSDQTNCSDCHSGFNFTNYAFENNGLYTNYTDIGRMRVTLDSSDLSLFKVPSLRNVAQTGPYMHDGSLNTLQEVLSHYNQGGHPHQNKNPLIRPLNLSQQEIDDIISFLNSLTDWDFANNPDFME